LTPITDDSAPRELKPLVQAINALMRRLSDALAMQRRFVADAAHALRTPVTALRLQVDLLDAARDDGARRAASAELRSGVDRAQRLIEQLLLLSRSERDALAPSLQSVALSTLARDAVARFAARADRAGIDLGARIDADALVEADAAQLAVLLDNLIDNALRHTSAGSTIDVVTSLETEGPTLSVVDGGPGIAADERARVFDRFYRGAPAADGASELGSGLGLAIAKAIADAHDATLSLRDGPPGRGLAVVLSFRRPAAGVARAAAAT
ncbi:MAG: two-component sensor histidine kinase, partial [Burkholderiales bacterium]|nr:two-component sensor histidine kinase [Burkholderiales bacterium]